MESLNEQLTRNHRRYAAVAVVSAVGALALLLPLVLAIGDGGLGFPHNDAWSYSLIAESFGRDGVIQLVGWNRGSLFGQIVPLGPLARSIVAQHLFVLVLGLVCLPLTYHLVGRCTDRPMGLLAAVTMLVFPGYALLSTSFMQDIPALAAALGCLVLGQRALAGPRWWLWLSMIAGIWGTTIREQVIAAPIAVLLGWAWIHRRSGRELVRLAAPLVIVVAAFGLFEFWRSGLPGGDPPQFEWLEVRGAVARTFRAYLTLSLVAAPLLLVAVPRLMRRRRHLAVVGATAGAELIVLLLVPSAGRLLGGYLNPAGSYPAAYNGVREQIPPTLNAALVGLGVVCGAFLPVVILTGRRRLGPILAAYGLLLTVGNIAVIFAGQSVFDRYLLPFVPVVAVLCGPIDEARRLARSTVAVVALGALTLTMNLNALAVDAALWRTGDSLVAAGLASTDVDAGFNWYGYHAGQPADQRRMDSDPSEPFYLTLFPTSRGCVAVMISPPDAGTVLTTVSYREFGFTGSATLWIVDTGRCQLDPELLARIASTR